MKLLLAFIILCSGFNSYAFSEKVKVALDADSVEGIESIPIKDLEIIEKDDLGLNPLAYSLQFRKNKVSQYLLDRKIGINVRDYLGRSPLMIGASNDMPLNFLEKFEEGKVDYLAKDKNGKDVEFYAQRSKNKDIYLKIKAFKASLKDLSPNEILELKGIFKSGNHDSLQVFYNKYRTINFQSGAEDLENFLFNESLIGRWNLENLLGMGFNIFSTDFSSKLIISGNGNLLESLENFKINYGVDSKGVPLIYYAIIKNISIESVSKILMKSLAFIQYEDKDGNNLLHVALKFNRNDLTNLLISKKVSLTKLNKNNESPLLLIAKNSDEATVQLAFSEKSLSFNSRDKEGNDPVILLSKRFPKLFEKLRRKILGDGYDYSSVNSKGEGALTNVPKVTIEEAASALSKIPQLKARGAIHNNLKGQPKLNEKIQSFEDALEERISYSGDDVFDQLVMTAVQEHVSGLQSLFYKDYFHLASDADIQKETAKNNLEKTITNLKTQISQLETERNAISSSFSALKKEVSTGDVQYQVKTYETAINGVIGKFENVKNYINDVNSDLIHLSNEQKKLQDILNILRHGKDEYSLNISRIKASITDLARDHKNNLAQRKTQLDNELDHLREEVRAAETRVNNSKRDLDNATKDLAGLEEDKKKYEGIIEYNWKRIYDPSHFPDHVEATCPFTKAQKLAQEDIDKLAPQITSIKSKIASLEKYYQEDMNELPKKRDALAKQENVNRQKYEEYKATLERNHNYAKKELENELDRLESSKDVVLKDVTFDAQTLMEMIELRYGSANEIDRKWDLISSTASQVKNTKDLEKFMTCSLGICFVNPTLKQDLNGSKMGEEFIGLLEELTPQYSTYLNVSRVSDRYEQVNSKIDESNTRLDVVNKTISSLQERVKTTENDLSRLREERNTSGGAFEELLGLEEQLYMQIMLGGEPSRIQMVRARIKEIITSLALENVKEFSFYNKEINYIETNIEFNDVYLADLKIHEEIAKEFIPFVLKSWHAKLSNRGVGFGSIYYKKARELFVRSLLTKIKVYRVSDKENSSIMIDDSVRRFVISEDGRAEEYEKDAEAFFDLELTSTGRVRDEIIKTIDRLKKRFKTDDLDNLKNGYDLPFILRLLKEADRINDVNESLEIISFANKYIIPLAEMTPYGDEVTLAFGLPECVLRMYQRSIAGGMSNTYEDYSTLISCASAMLDPLLGTNIDDATPAKALTRILGIVLKKIIPINLGNAHIRAASSKFFELMLGQSLDKMSEKLLLDFSPRIARIDGALKLLAKIRFDSKIEVVVDNKKINVWKGKAASRLEEESYTLKSGRKIINACFLSYSDFIKEAEKIVGKEALNNITGPSMIYFKENEEIYIGNQCLYLK